MEIPTPVTAFSIDSKTQDGGLITRPSPRPTRNKKAYCSYKLGSRTAVACRVKRGARVRAPRARARERARVATTRRLIAVPGG
eukprot:COSAG02_NODE_9967_length_2062_cov_0.905756_4_plen_83_part_00